MSNFQSPVASALNQDSAPREKPMSPDNSSQDDLNTSQYNPSMANNLACLIDDRISKRISLEMKKVSQMLIENLSVFVKKAA